MKKVKEDTLEEDRKRQTRKENANNNENLIKIYEQKKNEKDKQVKYKYI